MMMGQRDWLFRQEASKPTAVGVTLQRFWSYFRQYTLVLVVVGVVIVASTYLQVLVPSLIGEAVDCYLAPATASNISGTSQAHCWLTQLPPNATQGDYLTGLAAIVALIAGIYVVSSLLTGVQFFLMAYMGQNVLRTLREQVFQQIHRLSLGYYSRHEAGDVMSRITNDADTIQQAVGFPLVGVVQGGLMIVWIAYTMLTQNLLLALIALCVTPAMFIATSW